MKKLIYKGITPELKDLDLKDRVVTGYFSKFGNVDSDGDMIVKGAYAKTLKENSVIGKNRIVHLYQHDVNRVLGKPHVLKEDSEGLYFETKFADVSYAMDVLKLYEAGVINEHSVGFQTIQAEGKGNYNEIREIKLFEGSTVTFGANENTPFTGFKGQLESANQYLKAMQGLMKNGNLTDETFYLLEYNLKQLERFVNESQQEHKPIEKSTTNEDLLPSIKEAFAEQKLKFIDFTL